MPPQGHNIGTKIYSDLRCGHFLCLTRDMDIKLELPLLAKLALVQPVGHLASGLESAEDVVKGYLEDSLLVSEMRKLAKAYPRVGNVEWPMTDGYIYGCGRYIGGHNHIM